MRSAWHEVALLQDVVFGAQNARYYFDMIRIDIFTSEQGCMSKVRMNATMRWAVKGFNIVNMYSVEQRMLKIDIALAKLGP
eukprot:4304315-Amphidinium_carterae.2